MNNNVCFITFNLLCNDGFITNHIVDGWNPSPLNWDYCIIPNSIMWSTYLKLTARYIRPEHAETNSPNSWVLFSPHAPVFSRTSPKTERETLNIWKLSIPCTKNHVSNFGRWCLHKELKSWTGVDFINGNEFQDPKMDIPLHRPSMPYIYIIFLYGLYMVGTSNQSVHEMATPVIHHSGGYPEWCLR